MAPTDVCRADEGVPIHIGDYFNIQYEIILHAIEAAKDDIHMTVHMYVPIQSHYLINIHLMHFFQD